ncbi:MAG TPA: transcription antitermination factor NusB [Actinomycetota bacterium]|nr:transcription antitermination factor NusB [Actinomycetota bacterium]
MTTRRRARRVALEVLFQADLTGRDPREVLADRRGAGEDVPRFAAELVEGVATHLGELDALLEGHAEGWPVRRMAAVDRAILRLACYELLHRPDVPVGAAIDEAVEAAKELSTEDSGRFVNGVLGRIAREHPRPG